MERGECFVCKAEKSIDDLNVCVTCGEGTCDTCPPVCQCSVHEQTAELEPDSSFEILLPHLSDEQVITTARDMAKAIPVRVAINTRKMGLQVISDFLSIVRIRVVETALSEV